MRRAMRSKVREQLRQRTALGDVGLHAAGVERDAARVHDQRVAVELQRSDDDLRRADELADANHRRVGQHGGRRHLQPLERLLPLRRA